MLLQPRGNPTHSSKEGAQCPELGSNLRLPHCLLSWGSGIDTAHAPRGCWEGDAQHIPRSPRARGTSAASEAPAAFPDRSAQVHVGDGLRTTRGGSGWGNRPPAGSRGSTQEARDGGWPGRPPSNPLHTHLQTYRAGARSSLRCPPSPSPAPRPRASLHSRG